MKTFPILRGCVLAAVWLAVTAGAVAQPAPATSADTAGVNGPTAGTSNPETTDAPAKGIHFGVGPEDTSQVVSALDARFAADEHRQLTVKGPMVAYTDGGGLANGLSLAKAALAGYYYLVNRGSTGERFLNPEGGAQNRYAALDEIRYPRTPQYPYGGPVVQTGPIVASALVALGDLDPVRTGSFEARLLQVEWLGGGGEAFPRQEPTTQGAVVFWLKSDPGGADLVCPLTTFANGAMQAGKLYSANELQMALESFAQPLPLTQEIVGASTIKQPKAAARAALDLVQAVRQDAEYASALTHPALLSDLNVLASEANAILKDGGRNPPAVAKLLDEFSLALAQTVSWAGGVARRSAETQDNKDKSLALEKKLQEIQSL